MNSEMPPQEEASSKKVTVTLKLDAEVVRWFMKQDDGADYHARINNSLRAYMESKQRQQVKIARIEQIKRQLAEKGLG
ncbi:BrnA antitoxin family protein [Candidatus Albibeggiatoa sp. nov. NOAA]|uniref:BrnA antitoxin family protein n=1 Tax=Candidatus Albibeggiatoa sp. nov. NOAA TaxID=3162724 RepID=UPI0032F186A1|nr:BrnA antitoxin family protein [Thiotrichaceae bacterium]